MKLRHFEVIFVNYSQKSSRTSVEYQSITLRTSTESQARINQTSIRFTEALKADRSACITGRAAQLPRRRLTIVGASRGGPSLLHQLGQSCRKYAREPYHTREARRKSNLVVWIEELHSSCHHSNSCSCVSRLSTLVRHNLSNLQLWGCAAWRSRQQQHNKLFGGRLFNRLRVGRAQKR